jgi:hypothetical protein
MRLRWRSGIISPECTAIESFIHSKYSLSTSSPSHECRPMIWYAHDWVMGAWSKSLKNISRGNIQASGISIKSLLMFILIVHCYCLIFSKYLSFVRLRWFAELREKHPTKQWTNARLHSEVTYRFILVSAWGFCWEKGGSVAVCRDDQSKPISSGSIPVSNRDCVLMASLMFSSFRSSMSVRSKCSLWNSWWFLFWMFEIKINACQSDQDYKY